MHKMKMKVILIFKHELYPSPIPSQEANVQVKDSEKKKKNQSIRTSEGGLWLHFESIDLELFLDTEGTNKKNLN